MAQRAAELAPKQHPAMSPEAHQVYRALVDSFLVGGTLPTPMEVARRTGMDGHAVERVLAEMVERDWAGRDATGTLVNLYPFSARPTGIRVHLRRVTREVMCAIDALGVAPMLGEPVAVTSTCPVCDKPLRLEVSPDAIAGARPASLAVVHRRTPGPAHLTRCHAIRFVCSPEHGEAWVRQQGGPDDAVAPLDMAIAHARRMFGAWYSHGRCDCTDTCQ